MDKLSLACKQVTCILNFSFIYHFNQGDTQKCCLRGICIAYIPSYVLAIITFGIRIVWQYTIMTNTKLNLVTWQVTWLFCFRCLLHSLFVYSLLALASMGSRGGSKWKSQLRNGKPGILPLLHLPPAINTKIFRQLVFFRYWIQNTFFTSNA